LKSRIQICSIHSCFNLLKHAGAALLALLFALACCGNATAQQTIWPGTTVPASIDNGASGPLELGVSFKSDVSGTITGIRFYKSGANTGVHVGRLWGPTGALLASVTFTGETASGWQQANFSTPVAITANTVYVASYGLTIGHFSANWGYFTTAGYNSAPLHALQLPNGVYGTLGTHPVATHQAANYWVDVVFKVGSSTAPSITSQPTSKTVVAGQTASFSVTAAGTAPLSYQWMRNGAAISGAISSNYTTAATTSADNGTSYTVAVSNSLGKVTSAAATLTVSASTLALGVSPASLSFGSIDTGASSTLGVTLKNSGNSNVTISGVSTSGAGFSASNVSSGTVLAPGQSAALNVTFAPTSTGGVTGGVTVASNATNSPATISMTGTGVQSNFTTWVSPSLTRVGKTDAPGTLSSIALSGARGETVDTQVVVQGPAGGLSNVNVSATALTGPNGATIPASNVTLYREYYLSVTGTASYGGGSNPPLGSGTYAEPLIPFNDPETGAALCGSSASLKACNASISAGQNQPYWIDISIPHGVANSPVGTYTGNVTISSSQGTSTIPVSLTVWNFELPMQPSELSLWTLWPPASGNTTTTLARALMRNKVMGWYDPAGNASSDETNMGLNRSGLDNYYYIGIQCNGGYSSIPSTSQINTAAANFPAGLGLDFYVADELNGCTGDYSDIKTLGANAHAANRSVKTMMTLNATDPNLYGSVDHWVLLDSLQKWPTLPFTAGGDLWSYTSCNAGYGNTPEWMVDYPPINERIQAGFLNFTQGATGLLYYRADGWTAGNAIGSWNNVDTTACGGGLGRPGDGIFLYPPAPIASTESAPGIRLKAIRDGIQDYEYAQMLKNLGQLGVVDNALLPIATSWSNWSHDPNALQNARTQLGQLLHQLAP
jgi:Domain of unknown function (DUF4082)/Domain of unknown function (DUF4091)/Abnormal spindle-like microcephaly-assoc'd, ASPM-SPD-2-Hydin/Immunoglobulin I-set domain